MVLRTSLTPLGGGIKNPYKPQTVLVKSSGEHTFTAELPKGVFKVCLVGTGASGISWWFNSYGWGSCGGSGAAVELVFYNPRKQQVELYAGGAITSKGVDGTAAWMKLGGTLMITANGGTKGGTSGGTGGTYEISPALQVLQILTAANGSNGKTGYSGGVGTVTSASPYETGAARPRVPLPAAVCGWNISAPNRNAKQAPVSAGAFFLPFF